MSRHTIISALGVTQILAWGSSYYLPAVLAAPIARDTGWPLTWIVGGLSFGLLVAALVSPHVGRAIERSGGRPVLALSAIAIGAGQIGLAAAPTLPFYIAGWLIMGLGMGAGLYDAAFGTLGRFYGRDARAAITTLTLFGGFASTVCWPVSAFLVSTVGWRGACLAYAAIQICFSLPLYLLVLPVSPAEPALASATEAIDVHANVKPSLTLLVTLAVTLTLAAAISSLLSVHLLTILQAGGMALAAAVGLGALVGPSQVAARTIEMAIARYHHPIWTKLASVSFVAIGVSALWGGLPLIPLALAFYGGGIGLESIARGTLPLALFGASGYAALMGRLAMPSLLAQAAAPWVGALLLERIGAHGTMAVVASVAALNVALTIGLGWMVARHRFVFAKPQFQKS
jgi:MFS family permease